MIIGNDIRIFDIYIDLSKRKQTLDLHIGVNLEISAWVVSYSIVILLSHICQEM